MKTYIGVRKSDGTTAVFVELKTYKRKLRHIPYHSPTGFEWGYGGSGPADLALAILVDYFKERPPAKGWQEAKKFDRWAGHSKAWRYHQPFKWDFVTKWSVGWMINDQEIEQWLKEQED